MAVEDLAQPGAMEIIAQRLTRQGFAPNWIPELSRFDGTVGALYSYAKGADLWLAVLVDSRAHADDRRAGIEALLAAAQEPVEVVASRMTLRHVVRIAVYVIGPQTIDAARKPVVDVFSLDSGKNSIRCWVVDSDRRWVWTNDRHGRNERIALEKLLRDPAKASVPPVVYSRGRSAPLVTILLILLLAAIYVAEVQFAGGRSTPSPNDLVQSFGAISQSLVTTFHQYWRLFTGPLLHATGGHLGANVAVLLVIGWMTERSFGAGWMAAIFAAGCLAGAIGTVTGAPWYQAGVGASGGIAALAAAGLVGAWRADRSASLAAVSALCLVNLLPVPIRGLVIDNSAHIGGIVGGALSAGLMLFCWPAPLERPRFRRLAGAWGIVYCVVGVGAIALRQAQIL